MRIEAKTTSKAGLTLLEIITVVTIISLLATIAVCNVIAARNTASLQAIRQNLGKIEAAKTQWAFDFHKKSGDPVNDVTILSNYFRGGIVHQVIRETYVPNPIGTSAEATLPPGTKLGPYTAGASIPAP